jgi:hypothetical protein
VSEKKPPDFAAHIRAAVRTLKALAAEENAPAKRPKKNPTPRPKLKAKPRQ